MRISLWWWCLMAVKKYTPRFKPFSTFWTRKWRFLLDIKSELKYFVTKTLKANTNTGLNPPVSVINITFTPKSRALRRIFFRFSSQLNCKITGNWAVTPFFFGGFVKRFNPCIAPCWTAALLWKMTLFTTFSGRWRGTRKSEASVVLLESGYMGLTLENIKNDHGIREDQDLYTQYDWITKAMLHVFDIQKA